VALDDDQRHAFAGHLDRVCVAQLMGSEASANAGAHGGASQLGACATGGPRATAGASVDDAEQRTDRQGDPCNEPGLEFLPAPVANRDLATSSSFATTDKD
jgi:hypothetical protein